MKKPLEQFILEDENFYFALAWGRNLKKCLTESAVGIANDYNVGLLEDKRVKNDDVENALISLVCSGDLKVIFRQNKGISGVDRPYEVRTPYQMTEYEKNDREFYKKNNIPSRVLDVVAVKSLLGIDA